MGKDFQMAFKIKKKRNMANFMFFFLQDQTVFDRI